MSEAASPNPRPRRSIVIALVALVAAVAVLGATLVWTRLARPVPEASPAAVDPQPEEETPVLRLEPAADAGENPFTATVTAHEIDAEAPLVDTIVARTVEITQAVDADPHTGTLSVSGTTPGLYGGSSRTGICDPEALVGFLADDPTMASVWAEVLGITAGEIPGYVASLTSLVLTVDTLVTNHGFSAGTATPHQAVLQSGSAVMVDSRGAPVVRCECGNPLVAPTMPGAIADAEIAGAGWDGLDLDRVVTVTAAPTAVTTFSVSDLHTGELVDLPAGPAEAAAAPLYIATSSNYAQVWTGTGFPSSSGSIQTSTDGAQWTVALETTPMEDVAVGDGLAVVVGLNDELGGAIHTSTDGLTWNPAIHVVDPLTAVAHGDGTWVAVGDRSFAEEGGAGDASSGAIYRSDDGESWQRVATTDPYENSELAGSGELLHQTMTSVAYGDGRWIATATECAYRSCMRVLFTSSDTITWTRLALDERIVLIDIAHDGQEWAFVGGEPTPDPANNAELDFPIGAAGTSPDGVTWTLGPTEPDRVVLTGLNPGDGEWLAVDAFTPLYTHDPPGGGIYRSSDMLTWELVGTADEWTTSVALLLGRTATAPELPAVDEENPAPAGSEATSLRIMTEGLVLLASDGTAVQTLPYAQPAAEALDALTELLGGGNEEFVPGDNICSADATVTTWGGLYLMHPGTEPDVPDWWVHLDTQAAPPGTITVDGPGGVGAGQSIEAVRAEHPQSPTVSVSHGGILHDLVYLDVLTTDTEWGPYDVAVEVSARDGVVSSLGAPVAVEGEC